VLLVPVLVAANHSRLLFARRSERNRDRAPGRRRTP
jgi:hypothetical protein